MESVVLIIVGLPGSGKTTASSFFKSRKIPIIRMGDLTDSELKKLGLPITFENEKYVRENLRQQRGEDIYARVVIPEIRRKLKENKLVAVEGMKTESELTTFKEFISRIKIIFINAAKDIRYRRLADRKIRSLSRQQAQKRDVDEIYHFRLDHLIKKADFKVDNQYSLAKFYLELENILDSIKYGASKITKRN